MWSQVGLRSMTINKASGGDGIPAELFKILKDDAVKVLQSICQQIWKTQQWPQVLERSVFIPIPKKVNAKGCSVQLCSFRLLVGLCLGSFGLAFSGVWRREYKPVSVEKRDWPWRWEAGWVVPWTASLEVCSSSQSCEGRRQILALKERGHICCLECPFTDKTERRCLMDGNNLQSRIGTKQRAPGRGPFIHIM